MIFGIGIDISAVERFSRWYENKKLVHRFFSDTEIAYIYSKKRKAALQSLAVRFSAKEAFGKALGTGLSGFDLKDIAVIRGENGRPSLLLSGRAQKELLCRGINNVHVSLSHEKDYAIAQVILEKTKDCTKECF